MYTHYDDIYRYRIFELRHPGDTLKDEIILKLFKEFVKSKDSRLLEIGCGMGHTSVSLSKIISKLVGIDISIEGIKIAKERVNNAEFIVGDATALPFKDKCFDCVIVKDVLEHIENDLQAIKEVNRVLKNGGLLIVYVPYSLDDSFSFESVIKKIFRYTIDDKVGHVRRYNEKEIKEKLREFDIIKSFYFAHFLFGILSVFGVIIYDRFMNTINRKVKKKNNNKKTVINLLVFILELLKVLGKIEFIILRKFKGAGIFIVAKKVKR